MTIKALLGLVAFLIVSAWSAVASADAMYRFTGNVTGAGTGTIFEILTVTDQAVHNGHLSFSIQDDGLCGVPSQCVITGDPSGFVSTFDCCFSGTSYALAMLSIGVQFNQDGTLTGGFHLYGEDVDLLISGTGLNWSGTYAEDNSPCFVNNGQYNCFVTGSWSGPTNIPEPSTLMLFVSGITAGASVYRFKRRAFQRSSRSAT